MGLLGGGTPKPPVPPLPQPMPDLQDPAIARARRRQLEGAMQRSGRMSTMLTDEYSGDKLGSR